MSARHKHLTLGQSKLTRRARFSGLRTEQKEVEPPLGLVAERRILQAHRKIEGVGGIVDVFS
jgi:hypothetical protein